MGMLAADERVKKACSPLSFRQVNSRVVGSEIKEESFRAPLTVEEEQPLMKPKAAKLVAKEVEGVTFGFGQSGINSGKVRFQF